MEKRKLYAYLDINNPIVAWEVAIGRIQSICHESKFGVSIWFYKSVKAFIENNLTTRLQNELALEKVRQTQFPNKVSRLTGVYLFNTKEIAEQAIDRWGVNPKLKEFIAEIDFYGVNFTEVDSEWISDFMDTPVEQNAQWMSNYWASEPRWQTPLTEVIASGFGVITDQNIRIKAYEKLYELWPTSSVLFCAAMAGFSTGEMNQICRVKPAIIQEEDGSISGQIFINMEDFHKKQKRIIQALEESRKHGFTPQFVIPEGPDGLTKIPDLSHLRFSTNDKVTETLFKLIHES
ncbi:hypothetical protein [Citrobacter sedlakii]|uniref:hypothetical protein n=1 Tax=Citrobacter sedlakii TaxID=67826 RepID=UPI00333854E0